LDFRSGVGTQITITSLPASAPESDAAR